MKWSPYSSNLSLHEKDEYGECVGLDPTKDGRIAQSVSEARYSQNGEPRVFTLVDTNTLNCHFIPGHTSAGGHAALWQ